MTNNFMAGFSDEMVKTAVIGKGLAALGRGLSRLTPKGKAAAKAEASAARFAKIRAQALADKASGVTKGGVHHKPDVIPAKLYGIKAGVKG